MPPAAPRTPAEDAAAALLLAAANRGEAIVGAVRTVFAAVVLLRFLLLFRPTHGVAGVTSVVLPVVFMVAAVAGFGAAFVQARRGRFTTRGLVLSTLGDAAVCFGALLGNILWPHSEYPGLLRMPDIANLMLMVFLSSLRLTPVVTLAAGAANLISLVVLCRLDHVLNAPRAVIRTEDVTMIVLLLATTTAIGWGVSWTTRRLVLRAGVESARSERARRSLRALLHEHHDVRSLLGAARLQLDLLRQGEADAVRRQERLESLRRSLDELHEFIDSVKARALSELTAADSGTAVALGPVLAGVIDTVRTRFPGIALGTDVAGEAGVVRVVGGARGLAHVLTGLLVNACEGDGRRAARRVDVRAQAESRDEIGVRIEVSDDGPGLPPEALARAGHGWVTTKRDGSGLGLTLVRAVVESSGGELELDNPPGGGARVLVWLPMQ